jgi:hypothetical protein
MSPEQKLRRASQTRFRTKVPMSESIVTKSIVNTGNPAPGSARNPMHAGGSDLRMLTQVERWMAMIREINREQQEPLFDIQAGGESTASSASAKLGSPFAIKLDQSHRVLNSPASSGGYIFYVALIIGALATMCGLAWFNLYESAPAFGLASMSGPSGNRSLNSRVISSGLEQSSNSPPAATPDSQTSDRIQAHDMTVRQIAPNAPAEARPTASVSAVPTKSVSTASLPQLASKDPIVAPPRTASTGAAVKEARKLTPTPETRPTTIEGWTLREVVNGTAVIEGPNGVWRVTTGQTVPGVGRVDSIVRWGNRLVVATSRGLISTP